MVAQAAATAGVDPVALLALLKAESGLNPRAERWGTRTAEAVAAIAAGPDLAALGKIVATQWPDISFGYSQRIVLYHELGDHSRTPENCLAVRTAVFADPAGDILAAALHLAGCYLQPSFDGSALSAMVVYNSGSAVNLHDPAWLAVYGANVRNYQDALTWAERFRA